MNIDLTALMKTAQEDLESANAKADKNGGYPVVYPGEAGKITFRLLYNVKSNTVQRKIMRHNKSACLGQYGEDCPVCMAIKDAETTKGKDCGAFRKYGYKTRGICYAKVLDADSAYISGKNKRFDKGDVIILMYPRGVYDEINKLIVDAGANLDKLVSHNEGIPIVLENTGKQGNALYKVSLFPYGTMKAFDETDGDKKFDELLESLPSLSETCIPMHPTDDIRKELKALAETVTQEFIYGNIVNPDDELPFKEDKPKQVESVNPVLTPTQSQPTVAAKVSNEVSMPQPIVEGSMPECFGCHSNTESKCLICLNESECYQETEKRSK